VGADRQRRLADRAGLNMTAHVPVLVLPRRDYRRNRARWLDARRRGIGGSDAPAVLGLHPYESPLSLWLDKTRPSATDCQTQAMRWGTVLEDAIARELAAEHGVHLGPCPGLLAHPRAHHRQATVDRLILDSHRGRPVAPLEVKTANAFAAGEWDADGPPPDHVVIQLQHQLDVGGWDHGYVAALVGGQQPRWWHVERDNDLIGMLTDAEDRFWTDHVLARVPPAATGHDADFAALAEIYRGDPDAEVVLDEELLELWATRQDCKAAAEFAEAERKRADAQLLAAIGDARFGLRPDHTKAFTAVHVNARTVLDQDRLKREQPDLHAAMQRPVAPYSYLLPPRARKAKEAAHAAA
jgi:putative phage-type endonuclease